METQEQLEARSRAFCRWRSNRGPVPSNESWPEMYAAFRRYKSYENFNTRRKRKNKRMQKRKALFTDFTNSKPVYRPLSTDSSVKNAQTSQITAPPVSLSRPVYPTSVSSKPVYSEHSESVSSKQPVYSESVSSKPAYSKPVSSNPVADEDDKEKEKLKQALRETLRSLFENWGDWDSLSRALSC